MNTKMLSNQYRRSQYGVEAILRLSYLHNGISYTGNMTFFLLNEGTVFNELKRILLLPSMISRHLPQVLMAYIKNRSCVIRNDKYMCFLD